MPAEERPADRPLDAFEIVVVVPSRPSPLHAGPVQQLVRPDVAARSRPAARLVDRAVPVPEEEVAGERHAVVLGNEQARVASVPGTAFFESETGKRMLRFCYAKDFGALEEACRRIQRFCGNLK